MTSHFSLKDTTHYEKWRTQKLTLYPYKNPERLFVNISDPHQLTAEEKKQIQKNIVDYNFCFYRVPERFNNKPTIHALGLQVGLKQLDHNLCADEDKLTSITVCTHTNQHNYIPYSSRQLSWHTDGYYNSDKEQINGVLLHCVRPAKTGGVSYIMDSELAYILLRDHNPDFIRALQHPKALTIPANIFKGTTIRPAVSAAVFSLTPNGSLHMRYSARKRNIIWRDDKNTQGAVRFLNRLWSDDNPFIREYTLQVGEGILCNNSLHRRSNFEDWEETGRNRLLYRGRYFDRIQIV